MKFSADVTGILHSRVEYQLEVHMTSKRLGLYGQVNKRMWWMPWRQKAMKDVVACDKLRGAGKRALIRRFPNGETRPQGHP
jgi:hypothetical protein